MRPTRTEGLEYYTRVADHFKLNLKLFEQVTSVSKSDSEISVATTKATYATKNLTVATGYYDNPNMLNVPGEELPTVFHFYTEPYQFYRQRVAVIGAKNSAAIAALELYRHGAKVTLIHRGAALSEKVKYWIRPDIENRISEGSVTALFNTTVARILPDTLKLVQDGKQIEIPNDFVFAMTGYHPDDGFLKSIGITLDEESSAPMYNPETLETNVKGIFVAGSVVAGKNNNKIFIENGRLHGTMIVSSIISGAR